MGMITIVLTAEILIIILCSIYIAYVLGNIIATNCADRKLLREMGPYIIKIANESDFTLKQFGVDVGEYESPDSALKWQYIYGGAELIVLEKNIVPVRFCESKLGGIKDFTYLYAPVFSVFDGNFRAFYAPCHG